MAAMEEAADDGFAAPPTEMKGLRACKVCTLIKTFSQFHDEGCDNCDFLELLENQSRVAECTSAFFEGMISIISPEDSWVARWQRIQRLKAGVYAMEVTGDLPEHVQRRLLFGG